MVNATAVWAAEHDPALHLVASRGSHLVVPAALLGHPRAVLSVPVPGHFGRYALAIPIADGLVLLGLTDAPAPGVDGMAPPVPEEDQALILDTVNAALSALSARTTSWVASRVSGRSSRTRPDGPPPTSLAATCCSRTPGGPSRRRRQLTTYC